MPFPLAAVLAGGGALASLFGKKKQAGAARKKEKEEERLRYEAAKKTHGVREKGRIAGLSGLKASVGARGIKGGLESFTPEMFEERPFTGPEPGKETGTSFFGDALELGGGIAGAASDYIKQDEDAKERNRMFCAIYPQACPGIEMPGNVGMPNPCDVDPSQPGC